MFGLVVVVLVFHFFEHSYALIFVRGSPMTPLSLPKLVSKLRWIPLVGVRGLGPRGLLLGVPGGKGLGAGRPRDLCARGLVGVWSGVGRRRNIAAWRDEHT